GNAEVLGVLLDAGADPNQRDEEGATLLMWAAGYGKADNVALLLSRGADINARDGRGMSALAVAVEQKQEAAAQLLRRAGAQ
ncbi:MAG TPA: ankyrin repeat domain-containing protein, partial [Burkholderiaceae bacterium]|nr:ankyrin repeat domain-containing protein [Burkholderiaceae bacterium]